MFVPIRRDPVFHQSYSDASSLQKNVKFFWRDKSLNCVESCSRSNAKFSLRGEIYFRRQKQFVRDRWQRSQINLIEQQNF